MNATRRQFLKAGVAGSAALLVEVPLFAKAGASASASPFAPNPWVSIGSDGVVTLVAGHSEMGQGVRTSLAMILAEELEADWKAVKIRQASPGPGYDNLSTGSRGNLADQAKNKKLTIVEADVLDLARLSTVMQGVDAVFHFQANADVRRGPERTRADLEQRLAPAITALHEAERRHQATIDAAEQRLAERQAQYEIGMAKATAN